MPKRAEYGVTFSNWRGTYEVYKWGFNGEETLSIGVESIGWFNLLSDATSFNFKGKQGQFTVRKELRKSIPYWYGFMRTATGTKKVYVGRTNELSIERLELKATELYDKIDNGTPCLE